LYNTLKIAKLPQQNPYDQNLRDLNGYRRLRVVWRKFFQGKVDINVEVRELFMRRGKDPELDSLIKTAFVL
jgi:hypothetical protein